MPEGDPAAVGGDGGTGGTGGEPPVATGANQPTFTQSDLDRINADTRRKAEESATKRVLDSLGLEDVEKGKAIIAAARAAEDAAKTELQRAQEERDRAKAEADQARAVARDTVIRTRVENALRDAGINPGRVDGAIRLASLGDVKVADDGTLAGVEDVVKAVREASPEWFGAPGKPFSAPDASGGGGEVGFHWETATLAERDKQLAAIGVRRPARATNF